MADEETKDPFEGMIEHKSTQQVESDSEGSQDPALDTVQDDTSKGAEKAKSKDDADEKPDQTSEEGKDDKTDDLDGLFDDEDDGDGDDDGDTDGEDDGDGDNDDGDDAGDGDDADDDTPGDDDSDEKKEGDKKDKRPKQTARERIAELTKYRRTAEDRALLAEQQNETLMKRLDALEKKLTSDTKDDKDKSTDVKKDEGEPDPSKYAYGELDPKYISDLTDYRVDKRFIKEKSETQEKQQKEDAEQSAKELQTQYSAKIDDGEKAYKDFKKVVVEAADKNAYPLTQETAQMALESPVGHHVIYKIASNLKLAKKLASLTPLQQARTFGRLEAQFSSKDAPRNNKTPNAGPMPKRRSSSGGVSKPDPKKESFAEFEKRAMQTLKET